jgi:hypothetical protein
MWGHLTAEHRDEAHAAARRAEVLSTRARQAPCPTSSKRASQAQRAFEEKERERASALKAAKAATQKDAVEAQWALERERKRAVEQLKEADRRAAEVRGGPPCALASGRS